jgi:hypothetical protein
VKPVKVGRLIALGFALFALVCGIVSLDYARGRVPETESALILAVLGGGADKKCRRDVSAIVARHIQPGMPRGEAMAVISGVTVKLPQPWFWKASRTEALVDEVDRIRATRTLRATAFGNELLMMDIILKEGRVESLAARVECAFG